MYSNAIDLISGKQPYKEIFIQYGFLTTLIHSLILLLFENKVFFISFFNIIFYLIGILFIGKSINNLTNKGYSLIVIIIILFNHPIPWLPWSNYLSFFFISISLFLLTNHKKNFFLISLLLSLSILTRQDFFIPIILSFVIFCFFNLFKKDKADFKNLTRILLGFCLPIFIFFSYLIFIDNFTNWVDYLVLPKYYLELYGTSPINLVLNFIIFFSTESFFDFISTPQYFLISVILIFNSFIIFLKIINRLNIPNNIFYIVLLSSFFSSVCLKIELFRLYTSVIFGLIPLIYFINNIKNNELKKNLQLLIILPAIYSFVFYPFGNNKDFKNIDFNSSNLTLKKDEYAYYKWPNNKINSINLIYDLITKCDVKYLDNLTFDTIFSTIGNYDRIRVLPYEKASYKNTKFHMYIDSIKNPNDNFIELINYEIINENIILLIDNNNNIYNNNRIKFTNSYKNFKINESDTPGKPKIIRVYFPSKCLN